MDLRPWQAYLAAFDGYLAAVRRRDAQAAMHARMAMRVEIDSDLEYVAMRRATLERRTGLARVMWCECGFGPTTVAGLKNHRRRARVHQ